MQYLMASHGRVLLRVSEKSETHSGFLVNSEDDVSTEMPFSLGLQNLLPYQDLSGLLDPGSVWKVQDEARKESLWDRMCQPYNHFLLDTTVSKQKDLSVWYLVGKIRKKWSGLRLEGVIV